MTPEEKKALGQSCAMNNSAGFSQKTGRAVDMNDRILAAIDVRPQAPTETVLIEGQAYTIPAPVAAELLRLHLENLGAIQELDAIYDLMDSKRRHMEELRGALIYHMEQTRPIQRSIDALAAANAVSESNVIKVMGLNVFLDTTMPLDTIKLVQPKLQTCKYPDCKCPTESPCLKGLQPQPQECKDCGQSTKQDLIHTCSPQVGAA